MSRVLINAENSILVEAIAFLLSRANLEVHRLARLDSGQLQRIHEDHKPDVMMVELGFSEETFSTELNQLCLNDDPLLVIVMPKQPGTSHHYDVYEKNRNIRAIKRYHLSNPGIQSLMKPVIDFGSHNVRDTIEHHETATPVKTNPSRRSQVLFPVHGTLRHTPSIRYDATNAEM